MKRIKLLGMTSLLALTLMGCQSSSDREAALEDQVEQLEQQVTSLEKEKSEPNTSDTSNSHNFSDDDLDSLSKAINDIIQKVESTKTNGSAAENQKTFFEVQGELQNVENRLEHYDDDIESQLHSDILSYDEARKAEFEIEKLEDKLDNAEDKLEYMFGYDD